MAILRRLRTPRCRPGRTLGLASVAALLAAFAAASPAYATSVSAVSFAPGSTAAGASSSWNVSFTTSGSGQPLKGGGQIFIGFPAGFTFTSTISAQLSSSFVGCTATTTQNGSQVTVLLGGGNGCSLGKGTQGTITLTSVVNPAAGSYQASGFVVATSQDTQGQAASSDIVITQVPTKLAFTSSPTSRSAGALSPQPVVAVQDGTGATVTGATSPVTLSISNQGSLTCSSGLTVNAVNGVATFSGCSVTSAGTYTLTAKSAGLTDGTSSSFIVSAGSAAQLGFVQQPTDTFVGANVSPAVSLQIQDAYGNAVSSSGQTVTLTPPGGGSFSATSNASGLASFSTISFNRTAPSATLRATSGSLTAATSNSFNVTVQVDATANALTDTAVDSGSGTKSVSYYYCSGYSGACTSASGTIIGSSTSAAANYLVSWASRPSNGAYRVIAVADDNVQNISSPSGSTPVTVTG